MAARGYPDAPERGSVIRGLDDAAASPGVTVFHAGTETGPDGAILAAGGRVLTICATAADVGQARDRAYAALTPSSGPRASAAGTSRRTPDERH